MRRIALILASLLLTTSVHAQSTPNLIPGKVPTAAEWNKYFGDKWDYPGPGVRALNKNGDVMLGILRYSMGVPTLTGCGTNPSIRGNNQVGELTMGTGAPTTCTITFNSSNPWSATPSCVVTWQVNITSMQYTYTTTQINITQSGTSSNKINYHCDGLQ